MRKQTADLKSFRGWITDVNPTVNPGCPTFQNLSLTPIGKLTKRKGWSVLKDTTGALTGMYNETGKDNGNIKIDFDRLTTGGGGYPLINTFHCKPYKTVNTAIDPLLELEYRDVLTHKIVNDVNEIWRIRYDSTNTIIESKKISVDGQLPNGKYNVKFIETPEHVYIINDYKKGTVSGTVYKYKYNKNAKGFDADIMQNISISSEIAVFATVINGATAGTILGQYKYMVIPVYNTSSEGYYNSQSSSHFNALVTITSQYQSVELRIYAPYDPFILGYKIYRTKVGAPIVNYFVNSGDVTIDESGRAYYVTNDFYFLKYILRPNNTNNANVQIELIDTTLNATVSGTLITVADSPNDIQLGNKYTASKPQNYKFYTTKSGLLSPPTVFIESGNGMLCTCGLYAQNRGFLGGDRRYIDKGFVSDLDKSDTYGSLIYNFELASLENEQTTIQEVGNNIFWFLQNSMYVLRPTSDALVPFTKELISPTVGCDSLNSACVLEGICYFIFNNKLWAVNEFGQYKEISTAVNTQLDDKDTGSEIILKPNASERYIKIMYRNTSDEAVNIDYYPVQDIFNEQTGDKDIYTVSGSTATLVTQDDRYKLVNYEQIPDLNEEWGVDIDGNIVKRGADYQDVSVGNQKVTWLNYTADSIAATTTYPVNGIFETQFVYPVPVVFNGVYLFGSGSIEMAYKKNNETSFSAYKTYTMTRTGTLCPLNGTGSIHSLKFRHSANSDIDLDFIRGLWTPLTSSPVHMVADGGT